MRGVFKKSSYQLIYSDYHDLNEAVPNGKKSYPGLFVKRVKDLLAESLLKRNREKRKQRRGGKSLKAVFSGKIAPA